MTEVDVLDEVDHPLDKGENHLVSRSKRDSDGIIAATHGSSDHPLKIGETQIPCYVLADGRRVLVLGGMLSALNMKQGTAGRGTGNRLTKFISGKTIGKKIPPELAQKINDPIRFLTTGGSLAYGYEATVLADLCEAIVKASVETKLNFQQTHIVEQAKILLRGFTRVGIIALVDEATGFQKIRARDELEKILQLFVSKELARWVKTFPDEYYQQMYKLKGWTYNEGTSKRPILVARYTNDIVYKRLAPFVLEELQKKTPKDAKGRRTHRYHQLLTRDIGDPRLREHLVAVIALMKVSTSWRKFGNMLNIAFPLQPDTGQLAIPYDPAYSLSDDE